MTRENINNEYFEWLLKFVVKKEHMAYRELLSRMYDIDFRYSIKLDSNRARDGIDLRYRFGKEQMFSTTIIDRYFDNQRCSVLEMMVALAIRCEEHIMDDPDSGNRTKQWFWNMMASLGLEDMINSRFDGEWVDRAISDMLNRNYNRNGEGGLFTIKNSKHDMRTAEIWYQMCWYLDDIL